MGTWGTGPFENDSASDWLYELEDGGWRAVSDALDAFDSGEDDQAYLEEVAVAAAAALAYALAPSSSDDPDAREMLDGIGPPDLASEVFDRVGRAATKIRQDDGELALLWREVGAHSEWAATVDDIITRLGRRQP